MTDPAVALAARIERFERAADPELIWDPAALSEAEQAMRACAGDRSDATTWRLIGMLHLARYRLDQRTTRDAAVAGAFFAAVAVVDPGRLPEKLRGSRVPPGESAETWAGLIEEVFRHVDPAAYRHVGLLIQALVRRAMAHPTPEVADRLGQFLLQESMRSPDPSWASGALGLLGSGLVRLYGLTGDRDVIDDAVHVLLRAALGGDGEAAPAGELAAALGLAAADDEELVRAYLAAVETPAGRDRSRALQALVDLTGARAAASCADADLLAFIRVGQCALDFWHEQWAHPGVLAPYAAGLIEWYVVTGNERSLEAGVEMLEALHVTPGETAPGLGTDPVVRLRLLGERRRRRYGVTGDPADLDAAVDVMRDAVRLAPSGHPDRAGLLADLADALLRRAVVTGDDPAEPVALARAALTAHADHDPARPATLLLLAQALSLALPTTPVVASEAPGAPPPLTATAAGHAGVAVAVADEAVAVLREALSAGERPDFQVTAYGLVSEVLCWRAVRVEGERRAEDLREAVLAARQGAELALKTSHDQGAAQRALCRALLARHAAQGDPRDLTEALTLAGDGDPGLLAELSAALDTVLDTGSAPGPGGGAGADEQLALVATELALQTPDEDVALKLLRVAEQQGAEAPGERGEFLLGAAGRLAEAGRGRIAGDVLERAVRAFEAAGSRSRAAYALSRLGGDHEDQGRPEQALAAYARSAAVHHDLGDPRSEAAQLAAMGLVHLRAGDPARAVEHHLRAIALCEAAGLAADEAAHQAHAAEAYLAAGDPTAAVTCAARARDLHLELGQTRAAALALVHAATAAVNQDDLTAAGERIAACAIELEAAGAWEDACRALDAHAVLLTRRGHPGQAAACETRLVEIVRRRGRRREPADEWYRIAQRRRGHGDTGGARIAFELARREYEALGHHDGAASVRYNLGALAYAEGDPERALEELGAAGETFAGLRAQAKEAMALTMRATCLTALGRVDDALADLDRALELAAGQGDLEALLTATLGRAAVDVELGELQEAEERLYSALGLAAGDVLKEAVVRDRLAALAGRTRDLGARAEALEAALAGFRDAGQDRLAALASIKLGFTLEARGEFRRARAALEEGLAGLEKAPDLGTAGAPFEVVAAMAGDPDGTVLARVAAIQLTLGDPTRGRATLTQALASLRAGGRRRDEVERLERRLRMEEAEAAGDLETARALAEQALDRPVPGEPDDRSYLLARLSTYCRRLGDLAAAYEYAARGHELRDRRVIEHLRNLGAAAIGLGRAETAVGHLTRAVELARDSDSALPAQLVQSLGLLAAALTDVARWREAAQAYEEGLALIEAPVWRALRAPLLAGRAALHLKLGELDAAGARYREAISIGEELGRREDLAAAYADLGLVHELRGEPAEARRFVERALDLERSYGRGRGTVPALIALAGLERSALATPAQAHLEEALALARELGFRAGEAVALSRLGALDLATASYARARRRLTAAIDLLAGLGHDLELGTACHHRSIVAEELGDLPGALADAERACALGHESARDRAVRLAVRLGLGMTAWTHAEHAKLNSLAAQLGHRPDPAPHGVPADLLEAEQRGLDAVRTLRSAARNTRDPERAARLIQRARTARAELEELWRRMEPLAPDHVATRLATPPTRAQLDALVSVPETGGGAVALLGFHICAGEGALGGSGTPGGTPGGGEVGDGAAGGGEGSVVVLAHRTGWPEPRAFPTPVDRALLTDFLGTADGRRPDLLDIEARRRRADLWHSLADRLLSPALQALGDDVALLHLFPHAELHRVPLHALAPGGRPLLERCPVAYAPSAAVLARLTRRPPARGRGSLVLGHTPDTAARPVVAAEAEDVATLLGTPPRTGEDATSALLPGSWDVVHLACPGVFDHADPPGSGIRLADGLLTARRLMGMSVDAGLVLVTAHEPGTPENGPRDGSGVAALGHALLRAGARSAVLALWPVSPEITRALMRDLHARLRAGDGGGQALRAAVLGLRELYGSAEPELWASYVLVGLPDGSPVHFEPGSSVTRTR
ncbi:CHAT domain-containing protein [Nonomuraea sp. NPDC049709]|uniref:CHAT domain-containing protein n=1 Tax=Nonomuraea sp. NPDC049709 TaxID=3154736 RepID=UPI00343B7BDF